MNAWKFNLQANINLDELSDSKVYGLRKKLDDGRKLTREEKNYIAKELNSNCYSRTGIPLMGWMFSFQDVAKRY